MNALLTALGCIRMANGNLTQIQHTRKQCICMNGIFFFFFFWFVSRPQIQQRHFLTYSDFVSQSIQWKVDSSLTTNICTAWRNQYLFLNGIEIVILPPNQNTYRRRNMVIDHSIHQMNGLIILSKIVCHRTQFEEWKNKGTRHNFGFIDRPRRNENPYSLQHIHFNNK